MTQTVERMLPLFEAKMVHHFDHRWATYESDGSVRDVTVEEKENPSFVAMPRYWVREEVVTDRLAGRWDQDWLLGWRRIARSTDERTFIDTLLPLAAYGDSIFLCLPRCSASGAALAAFMSSFAFDFVARQKFGGTNASFFLVEQLPIPAPEVFRVVVPVLAGTLEQFLSARVDQLETSPGAARRAALRADIDASCALAYGLSRADFDYILETFPIVKRKDQVAFGEFRTKRLVLEAFDAMQQAIGSGVPYWSPWDSEPLGEENK